MYYPKSQIKTNLYSNGGDYILSTTQEAYKGYYYLTSTGKTYTGRTPQDGPNILLQKTVNVTQPTEATEEDPIIYALDAGKEGDGFLYEFDTNQYFDLTNQTNSTTFKFVPTFNLTLPTTPEQLNGEFYRYFCKKNNETKYLEINRDTFLKLQNKDSSIEWTLYSPVSILWQIRGEQSNVFNSNKASAKAIEQNLQWYGFSQYFKEEYLKYYAGQ
jgi:hypothetical protein